MKNICARLLLKMCSWNWEKFKFIRSFNFTLKNHYQYSTSVSETSDNVCFYSMIGFPWSLYSQTIFLWCGEEWTSNTKYLELIQKKIKSSRKEYIMWTCFKFWPMKSIFQKTKRKSDFDYGLLTNLPRMVKFTDFFPSSFKLKRGILLLLTKYVS